MRNYEKFLHFVLHRRAAVKHPYDHIIYMMYSPYKSKNIEEKQENEEGDL